MALFLVLLLLLLVAAAWAIRTGSNAAPERSSTSDEGAPRSVAEVNRAAMRGETGKWRIEPSDSDRSAPPPIRTGPRGGRYTEAKTRQGRRYRRYF